MIESMQNELTAERIEEAIKEITESGMHGNQVHQETMETALSALRAEQERQWISVEDRLPDKTGKYLVFHHEWSDGAFLPTYEDCTIRTMRFMNNNKWRYPACIDKRCEADTHREVTHWMPLPEPPMCGRPLKGESDGGGTAMTITREDLEECRRAAGLIDDPVLPQLRSGYARKRGKALQYNCVCVLWREDPRGSDGRLKLRKGEP